MPQMHILEAGGWWSRGVAGYSLEHCCNFGSVTLSCDKVKGFVGEGVVEGSLAVGLAHGSQSCSG